jgi:hypothetical protein
MAEYVVEVDGALWVELPGRGRWELVPETGDDQSASYPVDPDAVAAAWAAVAAPFTENLEVTFVILPRPRVALPISSAEDGLIYLSPGSAPYTARQVHFLVAHESGHLVHRAFLHDEADWAVYRELRGLTDLSVYHDWAAHANRPREIFAEDFRFLFGGPEANYSGTIENHALALPDDVPGLRAYFHSLVASGAGGGAIPVGLSPGPAFHASPNPTRGPVAVLVSWPGAAAERTQLTILDAQGRIVRELQAAIGSGGVLRFDWDGLTAAGHGAAAGVYFACVDSPQRRGPSGRLVIVR